MEERTISVRNGMFETKLRTGGSGDPLLYLHGAGGLRDWDPFLAELAKSFDVYAPSHPGFESSTGIEHIDDVIDLVVYYNDFLDAIGLPSAHVVGHFPGRHVRRRTRRAEPGAGGTNSSCATAAGLWIDEHPVGRLFRRHAA